jgi:hypothetical protein
VIALGICDHFVLRYFSSLRCAKHDCEHFASKHLDLEMSCERVRAIGEQLVPRRRISGAARRACISCAVATNSASGIAITPADRSFS